MTILLPPALGAALSVALMHAAIRPAGAAEGRWLPVPAVTQVADVG